MAQNEASVVIPNEASTALLRGKGHRPSLDGEAIEVGDYVASPQGSGYVERIEDNKVYVFVSDERGIVTSEASDCTMVAKQFRLPV